MNKNTKVEILLKDLMEIHGHKHELFGEMLGITLSIQKLTMPDQLEEMIELLEARQVCIEKIDIIEKEIIRISHRIFDKEKSGKNLSFCENELELIEELKRQEIQLVKQMLELDEMQKDNLELGLNNLKNQIERIRARWKTFNAYRGKPALSQSVFLDEKK
ncbi:MAG: hypothetical protein ACOY46_13270 [Bacillota bacterium]